ncbi:MAG: hypothetical protein ACLQVI_18255 [Polyangiaceae bacterium]
MKRHANSLVAGTAKRATRVALAALAGILVSTQARAQQIPPPPQASTTRVTFEGSGTEVSLAGRTCTLPCSMDVVPDTYQLTYGRGLTRTLVVAPEPTMDVRMKGGSPALLVVGVTLLAAGSALFAAGLNTNGCVGGNPDASTGGMCLSIPLSLEATGVLWGVAGTVLTVLGIRQLGRERVEVNPSGPTNVAKWTPRVIPWAAPESNAHGGAAGLAVVF